MLPPPVHLVTDRRLVPDLAAAVRAALAGAPARTVAVHLREKDLGGAASLALARALRAACDATGQLLLVNDRLDVALAARADGVHLPAAGIPPAEARRLLGPGRLVGVSCHGLDDVRRAGDGGADFATFGPVFDTPSKRVYGPPVGLEALRAAAQLGLPLVALGGVEPGNAARARAVGAAGVAAIRAWLVAAEPAQAVAALRAAVTGSTPQGAAGEPAAADPAAAPSHEPHGDRGHGHHDRHGNPEDLDAYVARMEGAERAAWQRPDEVVAALGLRPGDAVADVGAGPGYFTLRLARAVGPRGHVYAVDVAPEMMAVLRERLDRAGLGNVSALLGRSDDPLLPPVACDLVLVVDTFHHFPDGVAYLRLLQTRLKPGGRLVNIDFHQGELPVGPGPEHKVARQEFLARAGAAGLRVVREETFLPYQYFLVLRPG